jgi:RND family efflux transporter MFP subunit
MTDEGDSMMQRALIPVILFAALAAAGCGSGGAGDARERGRRPGGGPPWAGGERGDSAAVPVEVAPVERRAISSYLETNGTLEAENEVDLVARIAAPIVELLAEEGMAVKRGQTLARLDDVELRAQLEISRVALDEATLVYDRAKKLYESDLISEEAYEQAKWSWEAAVAQLETVRIQLGYTDVTAPFDGWIVARYVDFAQQVSVNTPLFRISDFDPLLCPIQVPERELSRLRVGQPAHLLLEPWPGHRFRAEVLRISPVVDAATGTIKVTLEVRAEGKLRPGMFARVFLEADTRPGALVIPKAALSLESIGDTVYVADGDVASRREVTLGFREGDFVEVVEGVSEGESVVVLGHDGLSDGTPIQVLDDEEPAPPVETAAAEGPGGERPGGPGRGRPDFSAMNPEQLERAKEFMRSRGLTDEQIEERIRGGGPGADPSSRPGGRPDGPPDLAAMSPEQLERAKELMRRRGLTEEQINERIEAARGRAGADDR